MRCVRTQARGSRQLLRMLEYRTYPPMICQAKQMMHPNVQQPRVEFPDDLYREGLVHETKGNAIGRWPRAHGLREEVERGGGD